MAVPKVAAINDLSGLGRCSLGAAIPVLAAMGVQPCPLPTALLSCQTGFPVYSCVDMGARLADFAADWAQLGSHFAGIFTGFFGAQDALHAAVDFVTRFREAQTLVLVDPVLGDQGKLFGLYDTQYLAAMRGLAARADLITPNLTEACLLAGWDYAAVTAEQAWGLGQALLALGPQSVVIKGVPQGDYLGNYALTRSGTRLCACTRRRGPSRSGTGDLLAAVLCGGLVRGLDLAASLRLACRFLDEGIARSVAMGDDPREGVDFEASLPLLWNAVRDLPIKPCP